MNDEKTPVTSPAALVIKLNACLARSMEPTIVLWASLTAFVWDVMVCSNSLYDSCKRTISLCS